MKVERAVKDTTKLWPIESATYWDIYNGPFPMLCSTTMCEEPAAYFRWTGHRWWKLCVYHLGPHLSRL